ncbi:MAG: hypothetical protein PHV34_16725, partial [Verrucomicrobiae bacterium]|nr:hypothetical protein [Verrucomicrobiae bacterium]
MNNQQVHTIGGLSEKQSGKVLKLAIDAHLEKLVVAMQEGEDFPKSPQRFTQAEFLSWVKKRVRGGWRVVSCYEAGPFGYVLHRALEKLGVRNMVIRVPMEFEEQRRSQSRLRQNLARQLRRTAQRGRGLALEYGH